MEIYELPNEVKEKIFLQVYERQCFDVLIEGENPTRKLIEMLWSYKNTLARSIVWKWIVWWCYRTLLPENIEIVKDHIYARFRKMILRSYINLYGKTGAPLFTNPLTIQASKGKTEERWYHIEPEINTFLKTFMNIKNKEQIEKRVLRFHEGTGGLNNQEKNLLIMSFCKRFPSSFLPELCCRCGKEPNSFRHIITYPCQHKICRKCFLLYVAHNERRCLAYDIEKGKLCEGELKQKGWNYYLMKHCPHKEDYQKCKKCGYFRHLKDMSIYLCSYCYI